MSAYRREFDKTKCMSLLGKIIKFGKKSATLLKKNLTVKISKNKKKSYHEKINTNFHNNKLPKEGSQCICLSVILIDSAYKKTKTIILKSF